MTYKLVNLFFLFNFVLFPADTKQIQTSSPSAIENWAFSEEVLITGEDDPYPITFKVPPHFGEPGAILVKNNHTEEFYLTSITLTLPDSKTVEFSCNSWVYPSSYYPDDRVFFSNKVRIDQSYLSQVGHAQSEAS